MRKVFSGIVLLAIVGGLGISLESCNDPCDDTKRVSADFRTYNELHYWDKENGKVVEKTKIVEEDTFLLSKVTFEAFEPNAESYEWTVGNDPRKRIEKKFSLAFDDRVLQESPIPVKLKIKKVPNSKCFPDDLGVDSVTHLIHFLEQWPIYGKYMGSDNTDPNNKYTIEIFLGTLNGYNTTDSLKNLPGNCTKLSATIRSGTTFEFAIGTFDLTGFKKTPNCVFRDYDKKIGYLKPDRKTIVIDYEFTGKDELDGSLQKRVFTGIRQ